MKNKVIILVIALILVGALAIWFFQSSPAPKTDTQSAKLKVAATIFPLFDIVKNVGGDKIEPILILPPGASPHTYEASPSNVKLLQDAKLMFTIGAGVDTWAETLVVDQPDKKVVSLAQAIDLKPFAHQSHEDEVEESEHEHEHEPGSLDPHYWLSPVNGIIMAEEIAKELSLIDSANKDYYEAQAAKFISTLKVEAALWQNKLSQLNKKELVVFHDAWGYFANYFGLEIVAVFEPFPGKTPSPQYLIGLQEKIKEHKISSLFVEPQLSQEALTTLSQDLKVKVGVLDPLGGVETRNSYIELLSYNVTNVYEALK